MGRHGGPTVALLALCACVGCASAASTSAAPASSAPATTAGAETPCEGSVAADASLPDLSWLADAEVVRVERGWAGLGGGRVEHVELRREPEAFVGLASLVVAEPGAGPAQPRTLRTSAIEIRVPLDVMQRFLAALAGVSPPAADASRIRVTASDDYPSWIVDVESARVSPQGAPARVARFSSPATGERPAPWFVVGAGEWIAIDPSAPAEACSALTMQLEDEALGAALR